MSELTNVESARSVDLGYVDWPSVKEGDILNGYLVENVRTSSGYLVCTINGDTYVIGSAR